MMRRASIVLAAGLAATAALALFGEMGARASDGDARRGVLISEGRLAADADGALLYREKCAMCHEGPGMGTGLLSRRLDVAELSKRDNLPAQYVFRAARMGIGNMPPIPPGEVSDAELRRIADYLAGLEQGQ